MYHHCVPPDHLPGCQPMGASNPAQYNHTQFATGTSDRNAEPWMEIIEQPRERGLRFRYQCEGRSAGSIPGEHSSNEKKTFPRIKIHNYKGQAIVVVSCVTKDVAPLCRPHPHSLVGRDCKKGVCTVRVRDTSEISFPQLGIQCAKKKDVEEALNLRKEINVDPFQAGFDQLASTVDLNVVRLCFQLFLLDNDGKVVQVVPPVASLLIHDKKAINELVICRVDKSSGKVKGGDEVFLLCEKVGKDDIKVRFYEEEVNGEHVWEGWGDFGQADVHRQYAIVFKTPRYRDVFITRPVLVHLQLFRLSDRECSDPIPFTYMPEDPDPDRIEEKRKRKIDWLSRVMSNSGPNSCNSSDSNSSIREDWRQKLTAIRRVKLEDRVVMETDSDVLKNVPMRVSGSGSTIEPASGGSASFPNIQAVHGIKKNNPAMVGGDMANTSLPVNHCKTVTHSLQNQAGAHLSDTSVASGNSQPGSLDSLLNYMGNMPLSSLMSSIDPAAIQLFLDQNISFSSGDAGSHNSIADPAVTQGVSEVGGVTVSEAGGAMVSRVRAVNPLS